MSSMDQAMPEEVTTIEVTCDALPDVVGGM